MLSQKTIKFIESLDHDDLVCFLQVYGKATSEIDVAQLKAIRKEIIKRVSKEDTDLWDKE